MANPIRILLAEDQAIIRQGLRYILEAQPDMRVVSESEDGQAAIQAALGVKPDLILMDIRMPGRDGIEATRVILSALPETKIVLLTTFDIQEYVYDGIRAGAVGYILKDAPTQDLLEGIRAAMQGAVIYRSAASGQALARAVQDGGEIAAPDEQAPTLLEPLTERELEVLQHMAYGRRNVEIAGLLSVSEGTVKSHVHRILQKFGVEDRTQAVVIALRRHLVR
jgi:DNA-binding NarL/FixJ family response regulator